VSNAVVEEEWEAHRAGVRLTKQPISPQLYNVHVGPRKIVPRSCCKENGVLLGVERDAAACLCDRGLLIPPRLLVPMLPLSVVPNQAVKGHEVGAEARVNRCNSVVHPAGKNFALAHNHATVRCLGSSLALFLLRTGPNRRSGWALEQSRRRELHVFAVGGGGTEGNPGWLGLNVELMQRGG
jgi:hypothetical protein